MQFEGSKNSPSNSSLSIAQVGVLEQTSVPADDKWNTLIPYDTAPLYSLAMAQWILLKLLG